jgi:hypothetical protein
MIRIDMSEYMEKFSVSRLTGPPPGYIVRSTIHGITSTVVLVSESHTAIHRRATRLAAS